VCGIGREAWGEKRGEGQGDCNESSLEEWNLFSLNTHYHSAYGSTLSSNLILVVS